MPLLHQASATCPVDGCAVQKHQIDGTSERAIQVVTDAMHRHLAEDHPGYEHPAQEA